MDDKEKIYEPVPYIVFETTIARFDRVVKRLWIALIVLIGMLVASNGLWLWYESQFEVVSMQAVDQDTINGNNSFIGGDMDGAPKSSNN